MSKKVSYVLLSLTLMLLASCSEVVIDDFESGNLESWSIEGPSFLTEAKKSSAYPELSGVSGAFFMGSEPRQSKDAAQYGSMTSGSFKINRNYLNFLLGGLSGRSFNRTVSVDLLVDGEVKESASPRTGFEKSLEWRSWDVQPYKGKMASIRVRIDSVAASPFSSSERSIMVDAFSMSNTRKSSFYDTYELDIEAMDRYLLIPSSDNGASSSLSVLAEGNNILGTSQSIRLAGEKADYYIPVDISAYKGQNLKVVLTNVNDFDQTIVGISQGDEKKVKYDEPFRPIYHFSPYFGWTNDPNGMVYHDGTYHLAYQANPYGTRHSNMHWGHAVSKDLVHWEDMSAIIAPDDLGAIFSGSAVVDSENTSGFGKDALIAMYTSAGRMQQQSIAYSLDNGQTYTKYEGNPVISEPEKRNFRDPKVIRYGDGWVVSIAAGDVISFYGSKDLKNWSHLSDFGQGIGSHVSVWECPDLMEMEYQGKKKWALIVNINPGGPNGGSVAQYFIGDFDGKEFHADNLPYPLWVDEGVDNYAGVTFSNTGNRDILLGWMSNWLYSNNVPTQYFRNAMTLPRDLSIKHNGKHVFLASSVSKEVLNARKAGHPVELAQGPEGTANVPELLQDNKGAYEIDFTLTPGKGNKVEFCLGNSSGEKMVFTFDFSALTLNLDRSGSGRTDFYDAFGKKDILTHLVKKDSYKVQLFVDKHSTEMFINDGDLAFTNCMFPSEVYNSMSFALDGVEVSDVTVYPIE